ncbi:MAG: archease [Patescibacteria group bacterium]|nr:archease [Patescibacteria group bacterium]
MKNYNEKFKILPHTADLKIQVYGETKKELFKNALFGMTSGLRPKTKNKKSKIKKIKVKSLNLETLLVDFLSEVLYLTQVNKEIYNEAKFKKFSDTEIEAELRGKKVERFGEDIKAVTYHGLDIHQREDGAWQATLLFDI